jgi:hypothetical protein
MQVRNAVLVESPVDQVFSEWMETQGCPGRLDQARGGDTDGARDLFWWLGLLAGEDWTSQGRFDLESSDRRLEWSGRGAPWSHVTMSCASLQGPSTWIVVATELEESLPGMDIAGSKKLVSDLVDQWLEEFQGFSEERAHRG